MREADRTGNKSEARQRSLESYEHKLQHKCEPLDAMSQPVYSTETGKDPWGQREVPV